MNKYTVTRQSQYPDGDRVVEVSVGSFDYCNPGALRPHYEGEFQEYDLATDAAKAAIAIQNLWQSDDPEEEIFIGYGYTGGMTMPFSTCDAEEMLKWAAERDVDVPRCDHCGDVVVEKWVPFGYDGVTFCSEYCAEAFAAEDRRFWEEEMKEEMEEEEDG